MIFFYALVVMLSFYAALLAWIVYPWARQSLRERLCDHGKGLSFGYAGYVPAPADRPIVRTVCMRCGKVEYSNGIGEVVWEST